VRNYLVFDLGASNGRAVVARFDGSRFTLEVVHRFDNRPVCATGVLYWDLLRLYSELRIGIQKAQKAYPDITSLGVDTWGVDFGFIDGSGRLLGSPVHYRDERRNALADEVYAVIPHFEMFRLTGAPVMSIMSIFNLYAMKKDGAPELVPAKRFLMMPDLFHYLLSGEAANEYTDATTTAAYSIGGKTWEQQILGKLGLRADLFAPTVLPGTSLGRIRKGVCRELEVSPIPVVVPATHDTASAEAGIPVGPDSRQWAFISLGTWGVVGMETEHPVINEAVFEAGWGNEGSADGKSFLAVNLTGLWIAQQCREKWTKERAAEIPWEEIVAMSLAAPRFGAFIDVDDPAFAPVDPDVPAILAEHCRAHGTRPPSGIGEIARCIYESIALKLRFRLEQLQRLTGKRIEVVHLVGGGTQNTALCQWTADAAGIPLIAGPVETTVAGNLIMQLKGSGEVSSLSEGREIVARSSELRTYEPREKEAWDAAYARFLRQAG
jgi:rhamnulokinase